MLAGSCYQATGDFSLPRTATSSDVILSLSGSLPLSTLLQARRVAQTCFPLPAAAATPPSSKLPWNYTRVIYNLEAHAVSLYYRVPSRVQMLASDIRL